MDTDHFDTQLARQYPRRAPMHQLIVSSAIRAIASGTRRDWRGHLMRTIVVALVTMMGLTAILGQEGIRPRDAAAHEASGAIILANYGTATVDGVVADGEYGEGCFFAPSQSAGGTIYHFTLCETNDDVNDYYAFIIDDLTLPTVGDPAGLDGVNLLFDDDHDGSIACPHAEDGIGAASEPGPAIIDVAYCGAFDNFSGDAQIDGSAAFTFSPDVGYVYEMAHPLNSGDPADYALALHDTVGFCAVYLDSANAAGEVEFPKNCFGDGEQYGDIFKKGKYDDILAKLCALVDSCESCPPECTRSAAGGTRPGHPALHPERRGGHRPDAEGVRSEGRPWHAIRRGSGDGGSATHRRGHTPHQRAQRSQGRDQEGARLRGGDQEANQEATRLSAWTQEAARLSAWRQAGARAQPARQTALGERITRSPRERPWARARGRFCDSQPRCGGECSGSVPCLGQFAVARA